MSAGARDLFLPPIAHLFSSPLNTWPQLNTSSTFSPTTSGPREQIHLLAACRLSHRASHCPQLSFLFSCRPALLLFSSHRRPVPSGSSPQQPQAPSGQRNRPFPSQFSPRLRLRLPSPSPVHSLSTYILVLSTRFNAPSNAPSNAPWAARPPDVPRTTPVDDLRLLPPQGRVPPSTYSLPTSFLHPSKFLYIPLPCPVSPLNWSPGFPAPLFPRVPRLIRAPGLYRPN